MNKKCIVFFLIMMCVLQCSIGYCNTQQKMTAVFLPFTDNTQSQHIFEAFPSVSSQTILLTLDLNKIMPLLSNEDSYELYVIETSESQDKATITRGDINAIAD